MADAPIGPPPRRVLVVDDSSTIRAQIVECLEGYAGCIEAADGREGLARLRAERPDAVLTDLEMPVMDGVSLLREARADPALRDVPFIVITTVTAVEVFNECRALGCAGFVLKPVNRDYLLAKLRRLLR